MKPLKRIALDVVDQTIKEAIDRVWEWSEQFAPRRMPWLDGVMFGPLQTIGAGNVTIEHKLGRTPRGFIVLSNEGAASDDLPSIVSKDEKFMVLAFSGSTLITLWVWG